MPHQLSELPLNLGCYSPEYRYKILEDIVNQANLENPELDIRLMEGRDDFAKAMQNVFKMPYKRSRIIVSDLDHHTALDFDNRDPSKPKAIILDAAGSQSIICGITFVLRKAGVAIFFVDNGLGGGSLQSDRHSCSLFAVDHCIQLAASETLYELFEKKPENSVLFWDDLPPNFVWNAQSLSGLKAYKKQAKDRYPGCLDKKIPPNDMSYREYIRRGICTYPDTDSETGKQLIRNESINCCFFRDWCDKLYKGVPYPEHRLDS